MVSNIFETKRLHFKILRSDEQSCVCCKSTIRLRFDAYEFLIVKSIIEACSLIDNWFIINLKLLSKIKQFINHLSPAKSCNLCLINHQFIKFIDVFSLAELNQVLYGIGRQVKRITIIDETIFSDVLLNRTNSILI